MDGDDSKVAVQGAKGQKFNVPREKLLDPKTKKPFKPSPAGVPSKPMAAEPEQTQIPKEIQAQLSKLSPEEKQQLVKML
jgi:hypothetical protein